MIFCIVTQKKTKSNDSYDMICQRIFLTWKEVFAWIIIVFSNSQEDEAKALEYVSPSLATAKIKKIVFFFNF